MTSQKSETVTGKKNSGFSNEKRAQPYTFVFKKDDSDDDTESVNASYSEKPEPVENVTVALNDSTVSNNSANYVNGFNLEDDNLEDDIKFYDNDKNTQSLNSLRSPSQNSLKQVAEQDKKKFSSAEMVSPRYASRSKELTKKFKGLAGEKLICDFSCALQRDILVQGRLYITANWLCFTSNLIVWNKALSIRMSDIVSISKDKTAIFIPNAISVVANEEKYFFTSFSARDKAYDLLYQVWKAASCSNPLSSDDVLQLIQQNYNGGAVEQATEEYKEVELKEIDKISLGNDSAEDNSSDSGVLPTTSEKVEISEFLKDLSYQGTKSTSHSHNGKCMLNETFKVSLSKLFDLIFTNSSMFKAYAKAQSMTDLQMSDWKISNKVPGAKDRTVSYNIIVKIPVGTKTSSMVEKQVCQLLNKEGSALEVESECASKGVPYCDSFVVCNHYCLQKMSSELTHLTIYSEIKYTKSVWGVVKGFIEKNVQQGLGTSFSAFATCLRKECVPVKVSPSAELPNSITEAEVLSDNQEPTKLYNSNDLIQESEAAVNSTVSNRWSALQITCLVLLFVLLTSHMMMFYRLQQLEVLTNTVVPQYCQSHDSRREPELSYLETWSNLLEKQQKLHEQELDRWKTMLDNSLKMADEMRNNFAAYKNAHSETERDHKKSK